MNFRIVFALLMVLAAGGAVPAQAGILISELMYHPATTNVLEEFLELHNPGSTAIDLSGWRLTHGVHFVFPAHLSLPAGGFLVVAADAATFQARYPGVTNFVAGWTGTLSDQGDHVELDDAQGRVVTEVSYAPEGDWAVRQIGAPDQYGKSGWEWLAGHAGGGKSLELLNPDLPNGHPHNWGSSTGAGGTPGRANSAANSNLAPLFSEVGHFPVIPKSGDPVTINARVLDESSAGVTVALFHRVDGAAIFTSEVMFDDGAHGDGLPNDGLFGIRLPAHPDGTIIEFYLTARDASGHERMYPAVLPSGSARTANLLYQVSNEVPTGTQPFYRLIMSQAEYDYLKGVWSSEPNSDAAANGTFISSDGVVDQGATTQFRYNAGFCNRGHGTRFSVPHNFRVNVPADRPWQNREGINLNTQFTPSQMLGSALMRRARLPMAESRAVRVHVNGEDLASAGSPQYGAYAANELVNGALVQRQIPDDPDGNLYRGIRDAYPGNPRADLAWHGPEFTRYTNAYFKQNHTDQNDWSDLVHLVDVLNNTPDAGYAEAVRSVADVAGWMRYFAVNTLMGNQETTLATGYGDDFALYRGGNDPRFRLLAYDMDSVLGQGSRTTTYADGIFRMWGTGEHTIPALERLVKHPEFAPLYYRELKTLSDTMFSPAQMNLLLDQLRLSFPAGQFLEVAIGNMKAFNASQVAYVRSLVPLELKVTSGLPVQNGYPRSTSSTTSLAGEANALETRQVRVNGVPATWSAWEATWAADHIALNPGLNRVLVQAFNEAGVESARTHFDVWYDDGTAVNVAGNLAADTTWSASGGPYSVTGNLTVANGATLTIEPGTTVYLGPGVNFTVANGGRLLAEGSPTAPIRFTRAPGSTAAWGGFVINGAGASLETRIAHALIEFNGTTGIEVAGGTVFFDHLTFGSTDHQYIALDGASFVLSRCVFPTSTAPFELLHGTGGIKAGGHGIVRECFFGSTTGYNDIIDFTGGNRASQPIIQFLSNVFIGASDDILDLDNTDAWIEGNIFLHVHKNGSPDSASAISGGNDNGQPSETTILGNLFYDCDQAATAKELNFYTLLNNTIVHQTRVGGLDTDAAVINLADEGKAEGAGMYLEGNIIYDAEKLVRFLTTANVTFTNNLMSLPWTGPGGGNQPADPLFTHVPQLAETFFTTWEQAQVMREWFSLQPGSPARGAGPNGRDQGGVIPLGASVSGEPVGTTNATAATLTVGVNRTGNGITAAGWPDGSGYTHFRWRLDDAAWSAETPVAAPIALTGLAPGPHFVEVSGRRDSGFYQDDPLFGEDAVITRSGTWIVDPGYVPQVVSALRINEVLAKNLTTFTSGETTPDLVELHNTGSTPLDLAGLGLTDDTTLPFKFKFPAATTLAPGGFRVLLADGDTNSPGQHLGFSLRQEGESLYLYDRAERGGQLLDSLTFGLQIADFSLGRRPDGSWSLGQPTFGAANVAQRTGDPRVLRINEWLANARFVSADDFVELFNPEPVPVALAGLFLSDAPGTPDRHELPPLSFIPAGGCVALLADGQVGRANHLGFKLSAEAGTLQLSAPDLTPIDTINYGPQRTDVSQGRTPSGADTLAYFKQPTPGALNPGAGAGGGTNITYVSRSLLNFDATWKYNAGGTDPGPAWRTAGFNDAAWKSGPGLLGVETSNPFPYPLPIQTALPLTAGTAHIKTFYFRTHFDAGAETSGFALYATNYLDDGAVFYLNGNRVGAIRVADNPSSYTSDATIQPNEGQAEIIEIPTDHLVAGDNVLAVEVHQSGSSSTDVVFGLALGAVQALTNTVPAAKMPVVLNEIFARNQTVTNTAGQVAGWVELFNPGTNAVSLADLSLSDDPGSPRKWVFPPGVTLSARGYYTVSFNTNQPVSATNAAFSLPVHGGSVFLFDGPAAGGAELDALTFGLPAADFALGRVPDGAEEWVLTVPTEHAANVAASLGSPDALRLNEWMADPASGSDWFELYNGDAAPVALDGLFFTDDLGNRTKSPVSPLSFIGTGRNAYVQFFADKQPGANHVDFKLGKGGSPLGLFAASGLQLEVLSFGPQDFGVSEGRLPDGADTLAGFPNSPTPNASNTVISGNPDTDGDGLPDAWEDAHGLNPLVNDAAFDADGDGLGNLDEYLAGTDPQNSASGLSLRAAMTEGDAVTLTFEGVQGHSYTVQFRDEITGGAWQKLVNVPALAADGPVSVPENSSANPTRFYRLVTPALP